MPNRPLASPGRSPRPAGSRARGGFTLVELIIVLGIIIVLMSILLPVINRAYTASTRTTMWSDLSAIQTALEAYKQRYGDYPRVDAANGGQATLARAVGPQKVRADGPTLPALLPPGRLNVTSTQVFDRAGIAILYYPANPAGKPNLAYVGSYAPASPPTPRPVFNAGDNTALDGTKLRYMLGDMNANGKIDPGEAADATGQYLLLSAGPDRVYGPPNAAAIGPSNPCDDVGTFNMRF
ncbi:MAG TPA: prepilin-type N-terminal cleavage/methylation domain-containing protein [Humisphaera sp.]